MPDMSESLSRLRAVSPRLNQASDKLNQTILLVEQALAELNLGVSAYVEFDDEHRRDVDSCEGISYEKLNDQWCICHSSGSSLLPNEHWMTVRLTNAPRAIRLRVVEEDLVPKLLDKLAIAAEEKVGEVEKAAMDCEKIAAALKGTTVEVDLAVFYGGGALSPIPESRPTAPPPPRRPTVQAPPRPAPLPPSRPAPTAPPAKPAK